MTQASSDSAKFTPGESIVQRYDHWHVVIRGRQETLGDVTFVLKRKVESLGDVTPEEMAELPVAVRWFEKAARALFAPDRIDYAVLLDRDPNVHLDAFPRYERSVERYGRSWTDSAYPEPITKNDAETPTREQHHALIADFASHS